MPIAQSEFSFGRALNVGIEAAPEADVVVLASAHVYPVFDDWLERLLMPFEDRRVGLSFGRQTVPPGGRFSERRLLEQWFPTDSRLELKNPFCNNANAAVRRDLWVEQRYDEALTGLEDLAWARGAIERGAALAYVAEAPVVHVHDETYGQIVNRYRREAIAHKLIYPEQELHPPARSASASQTSLGILTAAQEARPADRHGFDILRSGPPSFTAPCAGFRRSGPITQTSQTPLLLPGGAHLARSRGTRQAAT